MRQKFQHRIECETTGQISQLTFPFEDQKITLDSIIGPYAGIWVYPRGFNKGGIQGYKQKCPLYYYQFMEHNFKIAGADKTLRKFTPEECEQVQGLPRDYTNGTFKQSEI